MTMLHGLECSTPRPPARYRLLITGVIAQEENGAYLIQSSASEALFLSYTCFFFAILLLFPFGRVEMRLN